MHHPDMAWTGDAGLAEGGVEDHGQYLPELEAGSSFDHHLFFAPIDANAAWACTPPSNTNHADPYDSECGGMHTTDDNLCPSAYSNDASDKGWLLPNDFDVLAQRIASRTASLMKPRQAAGKRPRSNHRQGAVACMRQWLAKNASNPYPSKAEKHKLSRMSGLTEMQVIYWFNNARKRSVGLVSDLQNMQCVNSN